MLKDMRMTSFLILHQMANKKVLHGIIYELWFLGIIYCLVLVTRFVITRQNYTRDTWLLGQYR